MSLLIDGEKTNIIEVCQQLTTYDFSNITIIAIANWKLNELIQIIDIIKKYKILVKTLYFGINNLFRDDFLIHQKMFPIITEFIKNSDTIEYINVYTLNQMRDMMFIPINGLDNCGDFETNVRITNELIKAIQNNGNLIDFYYTKFNPSFLEETFERNKYNKKIRNKTLQYRCWKLIKNKKIDTQILPKFIIDYYTKCSSIKV